MTFKSILIAIVFTAMTSTVYAQLEPFTDYDISEGLWHITTVKVDPNMGDDYLEGLRDTWIAANKVAKELGQIEDFMIYSSITPQSGDANLFLVIKYASTDDLKPNKEEYDKFMKAWGEANTDKTREISKNYPSMRTITGEYMVRKIDVK
jgi:hypothetical protein